MKVNFKNVDAIVESTALDFAMVFKKMILFSISFGTRESVGFIYKLKIIYIAKSN